MSVECHLFCLAERYRLSGLSVFAVPFCFVLFKNTDRHIVLYNASHHLNIVYVNRSFSLLPVTYASTFIYGRRFMDKDFTEKAR